MTDLLERARTERNRIETEERDRSVAEIRERLIPYVLRDAAGQLTDDEAVTVLEILDDANLTDDDYRGMRDAARAIAQDCQALATRIPQLEAESIRFARFAVARRRAERAMEQANKAMRQATGLRQQVDGFRMAIEKHALARPYFFHNGKPLDGLADLLPPVEQNTTVAPKSTCAICESDYELKSEFCSSKCSHIAERHADGLRQIGVLPHRKKKGK